MMDGNERNQRFEALLEELVGEGMVQAVLSNPVRRERLEKVRIRPVLLKGGLCYQAEELSGNQAFHHNMGREEAIAYIRERMGQDFRQCEIRSSHGDGVVLVGKKGTMTVKRKGKPAPDGRLSDGQPFACPASAGRPLPNCRPAEERFLWMAHNRPKRYLLKEGSPIPFLVDLGVMTAQGQIVRSRYDKFRQINRFLEFIEDVLPSLHKERENVIIDFGCGKSYLTFAMYYYLHELKGYPVRIVGLDLKKDVIARCSRLAEAYGYRDLTFLYGDIGSFEGDGPVDMVVTLHACDTATDHALAKAVRWNAKVILSVPCCQHELNGQIHQELMGPVFQYGLIKERMAALCTDALRAQVLEHYGYRTQVLEFIDMDHTPKNILIRAVRQGAAKPNGREILDLAAFLHAEPTLLKLLPVRG